MSVNSTCKLVDLVLAAKKLRNGVCEGRTVPKQNTQQQDSIHAAVRRQTDTEEKKKQRCGSRIRIAASEYGNDKHSQMRKKKTHTEKQSRINI